MILRTGDDFGFSDTSCVSIGIGLATLGVISHIAKGAWYQGRYFLFESRRDRHFCHIRRRWVAGLTATPITIRLRQHQRWYGGTVWHYPMSAPRIDQGAIASWLVARLGTPYDTRQAAAARLLGLGWLQRRLLGREDLRRLYCAETAAKADEIGGVLPEHDASGWSPAGLLRYKRRIGAAAAPRKLRVES